MTYELVISDLTNLYAKKLEIEKFLGFYCLYFSLSIELVESMYVLRRVYEIVTSSPGGHFGSAGCDKR